jgi:hypothetical protein
MTWRGDQLSRIAGSEELQISTRRPGRDEAAVDADLGRPRRRRRLHQVGRGPGLGLVPARDPAQQQPDPGRRDGAGNGGGGAARLIHAILRGDVSSALIQHASQPRRGWTRS